MASGEWEELLDRTERALDDGRLEEALALSEKALGIDPENPDAVFLRAESLLELGLLEEAVSAYRDADTLLPDHPAILSGLGLALFELVRPEEAERVLRRALELDPDLPEVHYFSSLLLERQGKDRLARKHLLRAVELAPEIYHRPFEISQKDFDGCIEAALGELPDPVKKAIQNTPITVEPFPSEQDLTAADPPLSPEILGLHRGPALCDRTVFDPWTHLPGEIVLYQNNLQHVATSREELVEEIRTTVLHEVGHALGLDEQQLDERGLS